MPNKNKSKIDFKIAFVQAQWHDDLVTIAADSCRRELTSLGIDAQRNIESFKVPGSLEIPLFAKLLLKKQKFDAIIAFGLVVDGGIYRHEFVAQAVLTGLVKVGLDSEVPILSVVLTPQKFDETNSKDIEFFQKHLVIKGQEAARSAIKLIDNIESINK